MRNWKKIRVGDDYDVDILYPKMRNWKNTAISRSVFPSGYPKMRNWKFVSGVQNAFSKVLYPKMRNWKKEKAPTKTQSETPCILKWGIERPTQPATMVHVRRILKWGIERHILYRLDSSLLVCILKWGIESLYLYCYQLMIISNCILKWGIERIRFLLLVLHPPLHVS